MGLALNRPTGLNQELGIFLARVNRILLISLLSSSTLKCNILEVHLQIASNRTKHDKNTNMNQKQKQENQWTDAIIHSSITSGSTSRLVLFIKKHKVESKRSKSTPPTPPDSSLHCCFWRMNNIVINCIGRTVIESVPHLRRNPIVIIKRNRLRIVPIHLYPLRQPPVVTASVQVHVTYLIRTRTVYLECIGRTPLKRPRRWII